MSTLFEHSVFPDLRSFQYHHILHASKIVFDSFVCLFVCSQEPCVDKQTNPLMALKYSSSKKKLFLILPPALSPEALMLTLQILHCPCSPENSFICSTVSQRKVVLSAPQVLENVSSHHQLHLLVRYIILVFKQRAFFAPVDKVIVRGPKQNRPISSLFQIPISSHLDWSMPNWFSALAWQGDPTH